MAVQIPRNEQELSAFFKTLSIPKSTQPLAEGVRELQVAAGEKSKQLLETQGAPSTLRERIAAREISPELKRREQETISQLFAAPEEIRKRFEGLPIDPTRVSSAVAGRMKNYLTLLDSIREQRKGREDRIDEIVKSVENTRKTELERLELELKDAQRQADDSWDTFKFALDRIDKNKKDSTRKANELTEVEIRAGVGAFDDTETRNAKIQAHLILRDQAPSGINGDLFAETVRNSIKDQFVKGGGAISLDSNLIARNTSMALVQLRDTIEQEVKEEGLATYNDIYKYLVDTRGERIDDATIRDLVDYVYEIVNKGIEGTIPSAIWNEMDEETKKNMMSQGFIKGK